MDWILVKSDGMHVPAAEFVWSFTVLDGWRSTWSKRREPRFRGIPRGAPSALCQRTHWRQSLVAMIFVIHSLSFVILVKSDGMHEQATALVGVSHFRKVITPVHEQLFVSATVHKFRFLGPFAYPLLEGVWCLFDFLLRDLGCLMMTTQSTLSLVDGNGCDTRKV